MLLLCDVSNQVLCVSSYIHNLQVSLGNTRDLLAANYSADQLPKGKFSTKGLGKVAPDPAQNKAL